MEKLVTQQNAAASEEAAAAAEELSAQSVSLKSGVSILDHLVKGASSQDKSFQFEAPPLEVPLLIDAFVSPSN